jgi:phospholipase C
MASVYECLRANPDLFNRTVLLVTYDEHGGLYDHVPPVSSVPNPGIDASLLRRIFRAIYHRKAAAFDFSVLGPRVPAVVISPFVDRGTVDTEPRDHASIPSTLRALFAANARPLTSRDAWAPPFHSMLARTTARTDLPDLSGYVSTAGAAGTAAPATPAGPAGPAGPAAPAALPGVSVGPASAPPDHYEPFVAMADNVRRRLAAKGVPDAVAVPGMPPFERTAQTAEAFATEAERSRQSRAARAARSARRGG